MAAKKNKGQALFEFLVFLPFTFVMVTAFINVGNSINGAINQQKVTRGYLYYEIKNNSTIPTARTIHKWSLRGITRASSYMVGWQERADSSGTYPVSSCYRTNPMLTGETPESCEEPNLTGPTDPSAFIRIYTVYGLCATPYAQQGPEIRQDPLSFKNCALMN